MNTLGPLGPIRYREFRGSPREVGLQHGQMFADEIRESVAIRMELAGQYPSRHAKVRSRRAILELAEECYAIHQREVPLLMEELEGIAAGAGVDRFELIVQNGFTDFRDYLYSAPDNPEPGEGCSVFCVGSDRAVDSLPLLGQTWDMHCSAAPHVVLLRVEWDGEVPVIVLSLAGCVGMLGMNAEGIGVCANNLHARNGRAGLFWTFVNRAALLSKSMDAASSWFLRSDIAGAHHYLAGDSTGDFRSFEQFPDGVAENRVSSVFAHTNHSLDARVTGLERVDTPMARQSSLARLEQVERWFVQNPDRIGSQDLQALTRQMDPEGGPMGVCMQPGEGFDLQTCAACVMELAKGRLHAAWGLPAHNPFQEFTF